MRLVRCFVSFHLIHIVVFEGMLSFIHINEIIFCKILLSKNTQLEIIIIRFIKILFRTLKLKIFQFKINSFVVIGKIFINFQTIQFSFFACCFEIKRQTLEIYPFTKIVPFMRIIPRENCRPINHHYSYINFFPPI